MYLKLSEVDLSFNIRKCPAETYFCPIIHIENITKTCTL